MKHNLTFLLLLSTTVLLVGCSPEIKPLIEEHIGFAFPDFDVINRKRGKKSFNGDYGDTDSLKFKKEANLHQFYKKIDERIRNPRKLDNENINGIITMVEEDWSVSETGEYHYLFTEGSYYFFQMDINPKDSTIALIYGSW